MPLHEYLEEKRRRNIAQLNASGACHICGSTCRNTRGFRHFLDHESTAAVETTDTKSGGADTGAAVDGGNYSENSIVPPPNIAAMRMCACFGQSTDDPDYWPYSLRVCEKCIEDDAGIGRIRSCGVCGTVACDENCGAELLECTDCAEWNNAGCLECRKMGDFSEMKIFRKGGGGWGDGAAAADGGTNNSEEERPMRITRICAKCLDMSTPWVKYDFVCRKFRCETRLVPSDIAERKRFCTFGTSPLNILPGDSLVAVVDFLSGSDLKNLFLTCSAMCTVAERVAKEKVERVNASYPTGPIVVTKRKDGFGQLKNWTYFEGSNDFGLRAPDDEKAWVGVYHYLEKITKDMFYFGFQTGGQAADAEAVERFLNGNGEKFTFGQAYSKTENDLVPCETSGYSVRGGCVLVTGTGGVTPVPLTLLSNRRLVSGRHRVICRIFSPGSGGARGSRDASNFRLGSIGILRTNQTSLTGEGPTNAWAQRNDITEGWLKEEVVVGMEYNADERTLLVHSNSHLNRASRFSSHQYAIAEAPGDLYIAMELTSKAAAVPQTLLSVREVNEEDWAKFMDHTTDSNHHAIALAAGMANGADIFQPMEAMEVIDMAADENNPIPRLVMRNRRRERQANNNDDSDTDDGDEGLLVRARIEGRGAARVLRVQRMERAMDADEAAPDNDAAVGQVPPVVARQVRRQVMMREASQMRRVVRAVRPAARAAAMPDEMDEVRAELRDAEENVWLMEHSDEETLEFDMDGEVAAGEFVREIELQDGEGNAGNNA